MAADDVSGSADFFGITPALSTNAPGSGGNVTNALDPTGAATSDLVSGVSPSSAAGSVSVPFGVGGHGGVEAAQAGRLAMGVGSNPTSTGAGNTDVDDNHFSQGSN